MSFCFELEEPLGARKLVLEDDNRTVYAYLTVGERIVSDVWLYNSAPLTDYPQWDDPNDLPFANRTEYIAVDEALEIRASEQVSCRWDDRGVDVYVDDVYTARLEAGVSPGASRLVGRDGPLGRKLTR